jgi:hypothetical protein
VTDRRRSDVVHFKVRIWTPPFCKHSADVIHGTTAIFLITRISFLIDRYAALSAIVLFPVTLNILLFHTFLEGGGLPAAVVFFAVNCFMLWFWREAYVPLLRPRQ